MPSTEHAIQCDRPPAGRRRQLPGAHSALLAARKQRLPSVLNFTAIRPLVAAQVAGSGLNFAERRRCSKPRRFPAAKDRGVARRGPRRGAGVPLPPGRNGIWRRRASIRSVQEILGLPTLIVGAFTVRSRRGGRLDGLRLASTARWASPPHRRRPSAWRRPPFCASNPIAGRRLGG